MLDVDFSDALEYLSKDKDTKVIITYIETIRDGRRLMKVLTRCKKPVIAIKAGKTKRGSEAAFSHTGSLAGSYEIYIAALKQAGCICVDTVEEALNVAKLFSFIVKPKATKTVVVTNAGGPGILLTDYLIENKIELVDPSQVHFNLPQAASIKNPIDILGDARSDRIRLVLRKLVKERFFDILILVLTPQYMTDDVNFAYELINFHKHSNKIVIACFLGDEIFSESRNLLEDNKIPCFNNLKLLADCLSKFLER